MRSASEIIELDWLKYGDAMDIARRFHQQKGFIWLDSASTSHPDSRYHIISWSPKLVVQAQRGNVSCDSFDLPQELTHQPFASLEYVAQQLSWQPEANCTLPFQGGWLGYWGYDLGRYLEPLPDRATSDIDLPDMLQGWYEAAVIIDTQQQQVFVCGQQAAAQCLLKELTHSLSKPVEGFQLTSDWRSNMSQKSYADKFKQVQNYLLSGDCYQVNLAQRHQATFQGNPFSAYLALREQNGGPFSAYIHTEHGQILSVSPERFIRCEQGNIQTKPIKGTRPRLLEPERDRQQQQALQQAPKDRAENLMIVDLLRNDIGRVAAPGSVEVPGLFDIESFPAVHHLVSTVTAQLAENKSPYDLLAAAFPGGSITGAPKLRAMEIIEELEPHKRNIYCGSIGYLSIHGYMDTNITIRTLACCAGQIYCQAGGGLVADSNCQDEFQETHDKVSQILPVLQEL